MGLIKSLEISPLKSIQGGMAQFYTPQSSHETMWVQIPAATIDDLFVHRDHSDQLLVVLQNRRYQYIPVSEKQPVVVKIPPLVPHGAINLSVEACVLVSGFASWRSP